MIIGIDARLYGNGLGLGRYVSKLIEHLERCDDTKIYVIFLRKENYDLYQPRNQRFRKVCADVPWYSVAEQIILPFLFMKERCDLVHIPHFNMPLLYPGRMIMTLHDLILIKHPHSATVAASTRSPFVHWVKYRCFRFALRIAFVRACRIITVSRAVADDLVAYAPAQARKVCIVYEAAESLGQSQAPTLPAPITDAPFFLYAGNAYPHKNLSTLLEAVALVRTRNGYGSLVMCGQEDFFQRQLVAEIRKRGYTSFIHHCGCVSDAELAWLYEHARATVLPSREEGFGLQILEAFIHGCPVIASRIPPYEEIAGSAALLVNTREVALIADALDTILHNESLHADLRKRGRSRAQAFSWARTARETVALYNACLSRKKF